MFKINIAPQVYLEGQNILSFAGNYLSFFGEKCFLIGEEFILDKFSSLLNELLKEKEIVKGIFSGICCENEIQRLTKKGEEEKIDFVVVIGGGKSIDTGKAVAQLLLCPVVTIPTSAATCACWTALSAIYTENNCAQKYFLLQKCPDLVIIDIEIISKAPPRYLASGMVDALAKYYETIAYTQGKADNLNIEIAINTSLQIHKEIFSRGEKAFFAASEQKITTDLIRIIETNIMLAGLVGGLGGEGCRAGVVHSLNNGFTQFQECHRFLHGEIVGFCNLVQLKLENKLEEIDKLFGFYKKIGIPVSYPDLGITNEAQIDKVIEYAFSPQETMNNFYRPLTFKEVKDALLSFR